MSTISILIADDYKDWRLEVRSLLEAQRELQIIGEACDGIEAVKKAEELKPDLVLLDVGLPELNGIEVARRIRQLSPDSKIIYLSLDERSDVVEIAMTTGAHGYVYKRRARSELLPAIEAVRQGKQFLSSTLTGSEFIDTSETKIPNRDEDDLPHVVRSPDVEALTRHDGRRGGYYIAAATALAAVIVMSVIYGIYGRSASQALMQAQQQAAQLKEENAALHASLAQLNESVAAQQRAIQNLRAQLGTDGNGGSIYGNSEQARNVLGKSSSANAQLLDDSNSQEELLADAKAEVARSNDLHVIDEASLAAQQVRIAALTDKLRIASATLDMERQLAEAGKDIRELMVARQLHVLDVRDTDPDGKPSKAFGRVFLTEGKSLTFYAFDLNDDRAATAKHNFEVWAVPEDSKNSSRSLGFLSMDAESAGRWVLKVDNPALVKQIDSVFVTAEPAAGAKQPSGQKLLYAYLGGEANHP